MGNSKFAYPALILIILLSIEVTSLGIKHTTSKADTETLYANEWNADHSVTYSLVQPTRTLDTIYQSGSVPRFVSVSVTCTRGNVAGTPEAYVRLALAATTPPTLTQFAAGFGVIASNPDLGYFTLSFIVPANYYYDIVTVAVGAGSSVTLKYWLEWEMG